MDHAASPSGDPGPEARALTVRDLFRIRDFRVLWSAQLVSDIGDGLTTTALLLLVNHLTGSTAALAAMAIALAVPPLTIGLVAGTYADRWDRRRIMLASDLLRGLLVLGFIFVDSAERLWLLYLLAFLQSSVGTFFNPAKGAIVPRVVPAEGLLAANSLAQATRMICAVIGTGIAGVMVGVAGVYWPAFLLDGLSFLGSFLIVTRLSGSVGRIEASAHGAAAAGVRASLAEGFRVIAGARLLWVTMVVLSLTMLGLGAINILFVPLVVNELGASEVWFGPLEASQTASMVLAAGVVTVIAARLSPSRIVIVAAVGLGIVIAVAGQVTAVWQLLIVLFAAGWLISPLHAAIGTILMVNAPDASRGRVASVLNAAISATSVISMAAAGLVAELLGVRGAFVAGGLICVASGGLAILLYPRGSVAEPGPVPAPVQAPAAVPAPSEPGH